MQERPGKAGFTMLLEPPNEAPAKEGFGGAYFLGSIIGSGQKQSWTGRVLSLAGPQSDIGGSTPVHVSLCKSI